MILRFVSSSREYWRSETTTPPGSNLETGENYTPQVENMVHLKMTLSKKRNLLFLLGAIFR